MNFFSYRDMLLDMNIPTQQPMTPLPTVITGEEDVSDDELDDGDENDVICPTQKRGSIR